MNVKYQLLWTTVLVFVSKVCMAQQSYFHMELDLDYRRTMQADSAVLCKITVSGSTGILSDSFLVSGRTRFMSNFIVPGKWIPGNFRIELFRQNNAYIDSWKIGQVYRTESCEGWIFDTLFSGNQCIDVPNTNGGVLCGNLKYNLSYGDSTSLITYSGGEPAEPLNILCDQLSGNQSDLVLYGPCLYHYKTAGDDILWFDSAEGQPGWFPVGSGFELRPRLVSDRGGVMYNRKVWYKARVDTNWTMGIFNGDVSPVFGPVTFYLRAVPDSIVVSRPQSCNEKADMVCHFNDRYPAPRVWIFYRKNDTSNEERWFLGTMNSHVIKLNGMPLLPESGFPLPPDTFALQSGIYRVVSDFTPWNTTGCGNAETLITVNSEQTRYFYYRLSIADSISCYGGKNGAVLLEISGSDTTAGWVISDTISDKNRRIYIPDLGTGIHSFTVRNQNGCAITHNIFLDQPPRIISDIPKDTVLCLGQVYTVDAGDDKERNYLWKRDGKIIGNRDTFSIVQAGEYVVKCADHKGCEDSNTIRVTVANMRADHDFLLPSAAQLSDTVFAVNISVPRPDHWSWKASDSGVNTRTCGHLSAEMNFPDTGEYQITVRSRFGACTYELSKPIFIGPEDSIKKRELIYGYRQELIKKFTVDPNPNDGLHYTIHIKLSDTCAIVLYKIDPVSGEITGDIDLKGSDAYETGAFSHSGATPGICYLKLVAGRETRIIKMVVTN